MLIVRLIWREMDSFSQGTVCMVLASHPYDEADYIRDYDSFYQSFHMTVYKDLVTYAKTSARKFLHIRRIRDTLNRAEQDPAMLWWPTLCQAAASVRTTGDHTLYTRLLAAYDPSLPPQPALHCIFVGRGGGNGTLPTYRRVELEGRASFEKVYMSGSQAHRRCMWFYEVLAPQLDERIRFPKLLRVHAGDRITVLNFEYCPEEEKVHREFLTEVFPVIGALLELGLNTNKSLKDGDCHVDPRILDFRGEPYYAIERDAAYTLSTSNAQAQKILVLEKLALMSPKVPGHGDIAPGNVLSGRVVADWDTAGLYPIAYDAAVAAVTAMNARRFQESMQDCLKLISSGFEKLDFTSWPDFRRNFAFFCYIHTSRLVDYPVKRSEREHIIAFRNAAFSEAEKWM